jgi:hypothetical protein
LNLLPSGDLRFNQTNGGGIVVEHSQHHLEVKGLSPATATGTERENENVLIKIKKLNIERYLLVHNDVKLDDSLAQ